QFHGRVYFRHLKSAEKKEDAIQEMVGLCWLWFVRLHQQGKDGTRFPGALASFAARHVRSGRKVCGQDKAKDVLSGIAQQRFGFTVSPLPDGSSLNGNVAWTNLAYIHPSSHLPNLRAVIGEGVPFRPIPRTRTG